MEKIKKIYNIGEVSKICKIPISTLRYYDEIGVLEPAKIDPDTGYRYYSTKQLSIIDVIIYFRYLDVPLKDIKAYLQKPGDEALSNTLCKVKDNLDKEIQKLIARKNSIQFLQNQLQGIVNGPAFNEVFIKYWPKRDAWALETQNVTSKDASEFNYVVRHIHNNLFPQRPVFTEQIGAVFSYNENIGKEYLNYKFVYLEVSSDFNVEMIRNIEMPEGEYVSIRYQWSPDNCVYALELLRQYMKNIQV